MAKKKPPTQQQGYPPRNQKYPWDKWANGEWHEITEGVDFHSHIENMRIQILLYARNHNWLAETRALNEKTIAFRVDKSQPAKPPRPKFD